MTTLTATKTKKFLVSGFINFPIVSKKTFTSNEILKMEADMIVGNKSHLIIAHEEINITWEKIDSKNYVGNVSFPILYNARTETKKEAIDYANGMMKDLEKVKATFHMFNHKRKRFISENGFQVCWYSATIEK